jgi:hypothetical protein
MDELAGEPREYYKYILREISSNPEFPFNSFYEWTTHNRAELSQSELSALEEFIQAI